MPVLDLTDEQVMNLLTQLSDEQKRRLLARLQQPVPSRPRPRFGSGKDDILYMAPDFDAPLDDFKEYM
jgi:hypothetical protein